MKKIIHYLRDYFVFGNKRIFLFATLFTALAVFINYNYNLNRIIYRLDQPWQFLGWYAVFLAALGFGYLLQVIFLQSDIFKNKRFVLLLLIAPSVFAWKMVADIEFQFSTDFFQDEYWNAVVYWPIKVTVLTCMLYLVYLMFDKAEQFYGATMKGFT